MYVQDLILEVTRRCNMACEHCLRGDAQNMDMSTEVVDQILEHCDSIGAVTFSGGEPSLNIPLIRYFFEKAEERNMLPTSFYVVTNGKENQFELATELLKWYPKMDDKECCGVALSIVAYHEEQEYESAYVKGLSFYRHDKEISEKDWPYPEQYIIAEGRAANWGRSSRRLNADFNVMDDGVEMLYVAANGSMIGDCDFSYDHVDQLAEYDVWDFQKFEKEILEEELQQSA